MKKPILLLDLDQLLVNTMLLEIKYFQSKYEIHSATSRDSRAGPVTLMTCKNLHVARYIDAYHYCHIFAGNGSWKKITKSTYAQSLRESGRKVAFFFDDQGKEIKEMRELVPSVASYLFDEHNKSTDEQKITSWSEIADLIL
jgi:hypothetical protein